MPYVRFHPGMNNTRWDNLNFIAFVGVALATNRLEWISMIGVLFTLGIADEAAPTKVMSYV